MYLPAVRSLICNKGARSTRLRLVAVVPPTMATKPPMSGTIELVGALRLPLGGVNGYRHLLGKHGRTKDIVPRHDTAEVAANGTVRHGPRLAKPTVGAQGAAAGWRRRPEQAARLLVASACCAVLLSRWAMSGSFTA